jgi:hypothetical protein
MEGYYLEQLQKMDSISKECTFGAYHRYLSYIYFWTALKGFKEAIFMLESIVSKGSTFCLFN